MIRSPIFCAIVVKRLISDFAIRLGKPFHDKNCPISLSSVLILLRVQIWCTQSISALTQDILCRQGTKLSKLVYCPVKVSLRPCLPHQQRTNTKTVRSNTKIIDSDDDWNLLLYKEAYHIKRSSPSLNNGLKASRELCLFS